MKYLISTLCLWITLTAFAQADYVVLTSTDTLHGQVTLLMPEPYTERLTITLADDERTFRASQLLAVRKDGTLYKGVRFGDKYRIMKQLSDGYLTLFEYRYDDSFHFGAQYLQKANGTGMEVPNIGFRSSMSNFVERECPAFAEKINNKAYKRNDVIQLVRDFNEECMAQEITNSKPTAPLASDKLFELADLLQDIQKKQAAGESIPSYMVNALKAYSQEDIKSALNNLNLSLQQADE